VDAAAFADAMAALSARFVAGDIDAGELGELAEGLRRQQETTAPVVALPDVANLERAWPSLDITQRRVVLAAATESLTVKAATPGVGRYDESRVTWVPVA
jgi:hypothetical protein